MQVARLVGAAGSGKTTELLRVMEGAKAALGGDPFAIGFASFTRAARAEAVSRAGASWEIPPDVLAKDGWFKTVHGVAHRMLDIKKGQLIGDSKADQRWIADALKVDVRVIMDDDSGYSMYAGDTAAAASLNCWELSRARVEPLCETIKRMSRTGQSPPTFAECKQFIQRYEQAKRLEERSDYADLLSRYVGIKFTPDGFYPVDPEGMHPKGVQAWIFDEAQDASKLVDLVCRRLADGPEVKWVYLAGDPFQAVFGFGGSDASHFMGWEANKQTVMQKSWRCPKPILELGERCLRKMRKGYWDRGVAPADHEGEVRAGGGPSSIVPRLDPLESTLIIARCNYTIDDWADTLKKKGIPFAKLKAKENTAILRGMKALWDLEHGKPVNGVDFACAVAEIPVRGADGALMARGVKTSWERDSTVDKWDRVYPSMLEQTGMTPYFIQRLNDGTWSELVTGGDRWRLAAVKFGPELATKPQIRIGTVHAAKGMEADTVCLATTTSRRVHESQQLDPEQYDEERRVEYVGVTRARKKLIVCSEPCDYRMML